MIYNDLIVNNKIFNQLRSNFKNNKIQNAYIFHGQEGVGKEAHAIEFFALINCKNPLNNITACKECNSCTKLLSLQHELLSIILPLPRNKAINKNDSALKALNEKQIQTLTNEFNIKGSDPYYKIKLDKANAILNWQPKWNFEDTLSKVAMWYNHYHQKKDLINISIKQINDYEDKND